jgi:hypothetical protein
MDTKYIAIVNTNGDSKDFINHLNSNGHYNGYTFVDKDAMTKMFFAKSKLEKIIVIGNDNAKNIITAEKAKRNTHTTPIFVFGTQIEQHPLSQNKPNTTKYNSYTYKEKLIKDVLSTIRYDMQKESQQNI